LSCKDSIDLISMHERNPGGVQYFFGGRISLDS